MNGRPKVHARCKVCGKRQVQVGAYCRRCWRATPGAASHFLRGADLEQLKAIILPRVIPVRVIDGVAYDVVWDGTV